MHWFWNRSEGSKLEDRLRSERPAPRPEFLRAVASRVEGRRPRTSLGLRVAFASALTLTMLAAVASVGGVSYAASGAQRAVQSVGHIVAPASHETQSRGRGDRPADDEYVKACKDRVKQAEKAEHERHKAAIRDAHTREERRAENARHKAIMDALREEKKKCEEQDD